jgi:hypothetical protein
MPTQQDNNINGISTWLFIKNTNQTYFVDQNTTELFINLIDMSIPRKEWERWGIRQYAGFLPSREISTRRILKEAQA